MEFYNSALIQDEILMNLAVVIDRGYPAGPSFLHSLGTLVEATVVHDRIYFDPSREAEDRHEGNRGLDGQETVAAIIYESNFVQKLRREGVLTQFPNWTKVDAHLAAKGFDYDFIDFISDAKWTLGSFGAALPEEQRRLYLTQAYLMDHYPIVFQTKNLTHYLESDMEPEVLDTFRDLIGIYEPGVEPEILEELVRELVEAGVPVENLIMWEGWNHMGCAYVDISRYLGLNPYLVDTALPNQLGAIQIANRKTREMYEAVKSELKDLDEEHVGDADYRKLEMPLFCQIVLAKSKDSQEALADEILNLRSFSEPMRQRFTDYERAWTEAASHEERLELEKQLGGYNWWNIFPYVEHRPSVRLLYSLWTIPESLTSVLRKKGTKLHDKSSEMSGIRQVRGLHDFWHELLHSPVSKKGLLRKLFPEQMDEEVWKVAYKFNKSANNCLEKFR